MGVQSSRKRQRREFWEHRKQDIEVLKEGSLIKQSKHLKEWRNRSIILLDKYIITFDGCEPVPTAVIPIPQVTSLIKEQENLFYLLKIITNNQEEFRFKTLDEEERQDWFMEIKDQKIKMLKQSNVNSSFIEASNRLTFLPEDTNNEQ